MPSYIIGNPLASGPQQVLITNPWSGRFPPYVGGVRVHLDRGSSGAVYLCFSGNGTMNSGGAQLSGGGDLDGYQINPGADLFVPASRLNKNLTLSGNYPLFFWFDAACSGQARIYVHAE